MIHELEFEGMSGMLGGTLLMGLLWLPLMLIVAIVAWQLLRRSGRRSRSRPARCVLEERYARGEIDREEYLRRLADLTPAVPGARRSSYADRPPDTQGRHLHHPAEAP
jgi:putative membrane protein